MMTRLTHLPSWQKLSRHYQDISQLHMRDLFDQDPRRFERFSVKLGEILFDYSKNRITVETVPLLMELAREAGLDEFIRAM